MKLTKGDYSNASNFFLISGDMEQYAKMVLEWSEKGYASEVDLFVTRSVLWLAEKKNLRDANLFFTAIKKLKEPDQEFAKLPLIHFCDFLLQTLAVCTIAILKNRGMQLPCSIY